MNQACVCDSGKTYAACCQAWHQGEAAPTAAALMRSRYSAYVLGLAEYLQQTWHASTRPETIDAEPGIKWLGLSIKRAWQDAEDEAFVEFVARYRVGGARAERLHEISRFVREKVDGVGRWFYVDGQFPEA